MIPYFILIIWTISITFFVVRNSTAINVDTREKTAVVCVVDNNLKAIIDTIIIKNADLGSPNEKAIWINLDKKLHSQLKPSICN